MIRTSLLAAALCLTLMSAAAQASWYGPDGHKHPETPSRKSAGRLGAWLLLTDREAEFLARWQQPSEKVHLHSVDAIERNHWLTAFVTFLGCAPDRQGRCDLRVKFRVLQPDGKTYADLPVQDAWVGQPTPVGVGLSVAYVRIRIEPGEALGRYTVHAKVVDRHAKKEIDLEAPFVAREDPARKR